METWSIDIPGPVPLANALRRVILSRVPGMAIDSLTIQSNTTTFWDEYIAHRLGMLAIRAPGHNFCTPNASIGTLTLHERNDSDTVVLVTAESLKSEVFEPVHPNTPLIYLSPHSELHFTANVHTKCGGDHMRFCPAVARIQPWEKLQGATLTIASHGAREPQTGLHMPIEILKSDLAAVCEYTKTI